MLPGFIGAASAVEKEAEGMMGFGTVGLQFKDRAKVWFGGDIAAGPEDFGQPQAGVGIIGPAIDDGREHRFSACHVALVRAIDGRFELGRIAALLKVANRLRRPVLAFRREARRLDLFSPAGTTGGNQKEADEEQAWQ